MQFRFEDATPQTRGSGPGPEAVSEPGVRQAPMLDADCVDNSKTCRQHVEMPCQQLDFPDHD